MLIAAKPPLYMLRETGRMLTVIGLSSFKAGGRLETWAGRQLIPLQAYRLNYGAAVSATILLGLWIGGYLALLVIKAYR